ncbi:MAG: Rrf2 family transcriptional regulator [Spirochaetes bacterium]|nr:Rrf2 family transcriptional regulator [Spirochaetota bacterium]
MKVSSKCEYALRCLMDLAVHGEGVSLHIEDIARRQDIPLKFLQTIILSLKKAKMVESKKGPGGGYFLVKRPDQIHLGDLIETLDGALLPTLRTRGSGKQKQAIWQDAADGIWNRFGAAVRDTAKGFTLEQAVTEYRRMNQGEGAQMFHI